MIIIIVSFRQATLRRSSRFAKKTNTIQYARGKCGTHARVLLQKLTHGNSKNEIQEKQHSKEEGKKRVVNIWKEVERS